ncbi:MAG: cobalamin-dependent protein [Rhizobiaceae bacterium]|nr:cobalamin-dependent protein [Rhizobiaceae bacterium]
MVQGRITYSRGSRGLADCRESQNERAVSRFGWSAPSGLAVVDDLWTALPAPDLADGWIMHTIGRKQARLHQVSVQQGARISEFVEALFDEDSDRCQDMLAETMDSCWDPQRVVELLMEPAARVIGENWCSDECDFLKVTIAVSRMQRLFRRLALEYPPATLPDLSRCALLLPAPGEQHSFGLSVVDDAFRRAGWDVDCCGMGEELESMRLVGLNHYQVIGVSISVERLLPDLAELGRKLRARSLNRSIILIAGGSMVMDNPQGAIDAGFDLIAVDAASAVAMAETVAGSLNTDAERQDAAE